LCSAISAVLWGSAELPLPCLAFQLFFIAIRKRSKEGGMKNQSLRGTSKLRLPEKWLGRRQLRCHTTGNPSTHNLLLVVVFALYAVRAQAQATPKYDFSLGYSYIPLHVPKH